MLSPVRISVDRVNGNEPLSTVVTRIRGRSNDVSRQKPIALAIDDHKDDGRQNPATVEGGLAIQSTVESVKKDGKVKEKIIGVGNGQFTWIYGMGTGVFRALGGIHVCILNARFSVRRDGAGFRVESVSNIAGSLGELLEN